MNLGKWFAEKGPQAVSFDRKQTAFAIFCFLVFLAALYLRMSGLFRGLAEPGAVFHPDEPKQILALFNFLKGDYVHYYGSLFYDGYPYGLNHLDEYLLRPVLYFLGNDTADISSLYYYARLLRLLYGLIVLIIGYTLAYTLTDGGKGALLALILLALAPLSVTVTHFATGDIGVDLFTALCLLFLFFYADKEHKSVWMFACGFAVGAAFSAKYNGMLVGLVPFLVICFEFFRNRDFRFLAGRSCTLVTGILLGTLLFTPQLLLDFNTSLSNMLANFQFIKDYNVPQEIIALPWREKAFLGLRKNSLLTISSLGYAVCLISVLGTMVYGKKYFACFRSPKPSGCGRDIVLLAMSLFPALSLLISLSGKYAVQPFHFSYLELPLIVVTCTLLATFFSFHSILLKFGSLAVAVFLVLEYGVVSWQDNFFWRLEDNASYAHNLPGSIYDPEAFYTHPGGVIRSLFLEPAGASVFRNHNLHAKGPDSMLWNRIAVAPLPQVPNPIGENWIFLNGPTFPRNDKVIAVKAENVGKTVKKYLVLPAGEKWPLLGIRSGSYATEAVIEFGGAPATIELQAHQQKVIRLEPRKWKTSGGDKEGANKVFIIPLEISVPHNDVWVTILNPDKEKNLFSLFGGGQDGVPQVPEEIAPELEEEYDGALSRIRYLEMSLSWRVQDKKSIPMWEVPLPAGRYTLIALVDGLTDESEISIHLEDARGELYRQNKQYFTIRKGIQRISYDFAKPFVPYQGKFVVGSVSGRCQIRGFRLIPDYREISADFEIWRTTGVRPDWVSRFGGEDKPPSATVY